MSLFLEAEPAESAVSPSMPAAFGMTSNTAVKEPAWAPKDVFAQTVELT
jgi:hypothetical protein